MITKTYNTLGMKSGECVKKIETALNKIGGFNANVDLSLGTTSITSTNYISNDLVMKTVADIGYEIHLI